MRHTKLLGLLALLAIVWLPLVSTASARPPQPNMICGNCGDGGGNNLWGWCGNYPLGTVGFMAGRVVTCQMWGGVPTWVPSP
jgi:hypothetical protein